MGSPFNTTATAPATLVVPATDAQLDFIETLLAERDYSNTAEKFCRRAAALRVTLGFVNDPHPGTVKLTEGTEGKGEALNALLAHMMESVIPGQEYVYRAFSKVDASKLIEWLLTLPKRAGATTTAPSPATTVEVPAGRYAIDTEKGAINETAFVKVDRPESGKWAGYTFVKLIVGGDEQRMSRAAGNAMLAKIAAVGPEAASARYGHEIGRCGMCDRQLTNDESRERGIGPICAAKAGW